MKPDFLPLSTTPGHDLATGFAEYAVRWAREQAAPAESLSALRLAAFRLSLAVAEGHVCLPLSLVNDFCDTDNLREQLLQSSVVMPASTYRRGKTLSTAPMLLDNADRLYLRRYYDLETRLAEALSQRTGSLPSAVDNGTVRQLLADLFPDASQTSDRQCLATAMALQRQLTVISGGPGTGKTTTVVAILACLFALHLHDDAPLRIALAAPTGKAAARMLEALHERADALSPAVFTKMPVEAYTLHRLLGVTSRPGRFRHHADNPLPLDVLIVDEASMLDLALATRLLEALPPHARLILLGDKDQLAAVEAGAVFAELSARFSLSPSFIRSLAQQTGISPAVLLDAAPFDPSVPLCDCVVWFSHSHRFAGDSGIGRLAAAINAGQGEKAFAWLSGNPDNGTGWHEDNGSAALPQTLLNQIRSGYGSYIEAVLTYRNDPVPVFAAFDKFRVLCAMHSGPRGIDAINTWMGTSMQALQHDGFAGTAHWYPGRPVIILRNDYVFGLFNGDIGICLPDADGELQVCFPTANGDWKTLPPSRLPDHDTAFAMTVHKSQGSEFDGVLVVLPLQPNRVTTRELLYTAVTRAKNRVMISANEKVFVQTCMTRALRHSGLLERMALKVNDEKTHAPDI